MDWISNIDSLLRHINRTYHRTTCASECCSNRCECNEVESSGEEIPATSHNNGHAPESTTYSPLG